MAKVSPLNKSFCLQNVCETNYKKLFCLIPNLRHIQTSAQGYSSQGKPVLHVQILEQTPYTETIQLSHCFAHETDILLEPAVKIRLYFDVCTAEVLRDYKRVEVSSAISDISRSKDIMDYKWRLNYFLEKWLDHCLRTEYTFVVDAILAKNNKLACVAT